MADEKREAKPSVTFHIIKTAAYETHHADGAVCGLQPGGRAFLGFYVERPPIPQELTQELNPDGSLGKILSAQGKTGYIREVQTGIILDLETAKLLKNQLDALFENAEEQNSKTETDAGPDNPPIS
jgi:hypothetical protein